jgi:hypothetical protein
MSVKGELTSIWDSFFPNDGGQAESRSRPKSSGWNGTKYKGYKVWEENGSYHTSLDPDSEFERVGDAKRFIDRWSKRRGNPGVGRWISSKAVKFNRNGSVSIKI